MVRGSQFQPRSAQSDRTRPPSDVRIASKSRVGRRGRGPCGTPSVCSHGTVNDMRIAMSPVAGPVVEDKVARFIGRRMVWVSVPARTRRATRATNGQRPLPVSDPSRNRSGALHLGPSGSWPRGPGVRDPSGPHRAARCVCDADTWLLRGQEPRQSRIIGGAHRRP